MIYGIGCDILSVRRVFAIYSKYGCKFQKKILTAFEESLMNLVVFENDMAKARYIAKRFCIKEAFAKALGTGFGEFLQLKSISLLQDDFGKPFIIIDEAKKMALLGDGHYKFHVSLSDDADFIIGYAVIESM